MHKVTPEQILEARKKAGLSQEQAAAIVAVAKMTWWKWEKGKNAMNPALFRMFCLQCFGKMSP